MTFKIIQYYTGNNQKYKELTELVEQMNSKYANIHGYNYLMKQVSEDEVKKYFDEVNLQTIFSYKIKFIEEQLRTSTQDYIVFMDADAIVSKPQIKLEELIDDQHELFLARGNSIFDQKKLVSSIKAKLNNLDMNRLNTEYFGDKIIDELNLYDQLQCLSICGQFFNQALFIIKRTPTMIYFFMSCYNMLVNYLLQTVHQPIAPDGRAIQYMLQHKQFNKLFSFVPEWALCGCLHSGPTRFNQNSFLMHNYGSVFTPQIKLKLMKPVKNMKNWTII